MTPYRRAVRIALGFTILHVGIAVAVATQPRAYGTVGAERLFDDVHIYYDYASRIVAGDVPYRDFRVEYPPLALPFFVAPRLIAREFSAYKVAFGFELMVADFATLTLLAVRLGRRHSVGVVLGRLVWYTAAFAALCPMAICRFDLLVTAWIFFAASALSVKRPFAGGVLAASGALIKLVPGLVLLPAVYGTRGWTFRRRAVGAFLATMVAGVAAWYLIGGREIAASVAYHTERGIEIGSLYSGLCMGLASLTGAPLSWVFEHKSIEIVTPWSVRAGNLSLPTQALALIFVARRSARIWPADPMRAAASAVLAFVVFGKVLSPQYLLWFLPLIASVHGRPGSWARGVFLLACGLTTAMFPLGFHWLLQFRGWMIGLQLDRNLLLVGLWAWLVFGPVVKQGAPRPNQRSRMAMRARRGRVAARVG